MIKELLLEPTVGIAKMVIDETVFQPTDVEEKTKFDVFWGRDCSTESVCD